MEKIKKLSKKLVIFYNGKASESFLETFFHPKKVSKND